MALQPQRKVSSGEALTLRGGASVTAFISGPDSEGRCLSHCVPMPTSVLHNIILLSALNGDLCPWKIGQF
eukprot:185587-Rhodomonas_salina.1